MLIYNLHCQLVLLISCISKICCIKTRPGVKLSLYLKKASLGSRNIANLQRKSSFVVSVSFIFFILHVKLIRSLLIQRIPDLG